LLLIYTQISLYTVSHSPIGKSTLINSFVSQHTEFSTEYLFKSGPCFGVGGLTRKIQRSPILNNKKYKREFIDTPGYDTTDINALINEIQKISRNTTTVLVYLLQLEAGRVEREDAHQFGSIFEKTKPYIKSTIIAVNKVRHNAVIADLQGARYDIEQVFQDEGIITSKYCYQVS